MEKVAMEMDDALRHHIGEFGFYQRVLVVLVCLPAITNCFQALCPVFIAGVPRHWCRTPVTQFSNCTSLRQMAFAIPTVTGDADGFESCSMFNHNYSAVSEADVCGDEGGPSADVIPCQAWTYDDTFYKETITTEWDLVCDQRSLVATSNAAFMLGRMAGCLVFGQLADRYGRRKVIVLTYSIQVISEVLTAAMPAYTAYIAMRFVNAMGYTAKTSIMFIAVNEFIGPSWRVFFVFVNMLGWAFGYVIFPIFSYYIRYWRLLQFAISVPDIFYFAIIFWFLDESPRWLLLKKRSPEAMAIIGKMTKSNKSCLPPSEENKGGTMLDLIRTPALRFLSLNLFFNWFANGFVYYGLSLNTSDLGGDPFLNFFIAGAVEIPAYTFMWWSLTRYGRIWPLAIASILGGVSLLATALVPTSLHWLFLSLSMLGKLCITLTFSIVWLYTTEVYPTSVRALGMLTCSTFARIASVLASYVGLLSSVSPVLPPVIFGIISVMAGLLVFTLPETGGVALLQTTQDGETFIRQQACFRRGQRRINVASNGTSELKEKNQPQIRY